MFPEGCFQGNSRPLSHLFSGFSPHHAAQQTEGSGDRKARFVFSSGPGDLSLCCDRPGLQPALPTFLEPSNQLPYGSSLGPGNEGTFSPQGQAMCVRAMCVVNRCHAPGDGTSAKWRKASSPGCSMPTADPFPGLFSCAN